MSLILAVSARISLFFVDLRQLCVSRSMPNCVIGRERRRPAPGHTLLRLFGTQTEAEPENIMLHSLRRWGLTRQPTQSTGHLMAIVVRDFCWSSNALGRIQWTARHG